MTEPLADKELYPKVIGIVSDVGETALTWIADVRIKLTPDVDALITNEESLTPTTDMPVEIDGLVLTRNEFREPLIRADVWETVTALLSTADITCEPLAVDENFKVDIDSCNNSDTTKKDDNLLSDTGTEVDPITERSDITLDKSADAKADDNELNPKVIGTVFECAYTTLTGRVDTGTADEGKLTSGKELNDIDKIRENAEVESGCAPLTIKDLATDPAPEPVPDEASAELLTLAKESMLT
jgi:hypothetical protein